MSRLLVGEVLVGGQEKTQSLVYDAFGNTLSLTTDGSFQSTPTSSSTNRLTGAGYDAGGNLTDLTIGGETYQYTYDPLNMMKYLQSDTGQARVRQRRSRAPLASRSLECRLHQPYRGVILAVPIEEDSMETAKLTVRLPKDDIDFAKRYARSHRITVTELIDRHFRQLRGQTPSAIHPEVERISGLIPVAVDAEAEYHEHLAKKHLFS